MTFKVLPFKMRFLTVLLVFLYVVFCEGSEDAVEERGKKKKIGLFSKYFSLDIIVLMN